MSAQDTPSVNVGVSVLVRRGERLLLEKRANVHGAGTWGPPSGHIEYGETPEETAFRETKEETGLEIRDINFLCVTNDVFEGEKKHYITLWFEGHYIAGEPEVKAPEEESDVGWFTHDNLPEPLFLPFQHLIEGRIYASHVQEDVLHAS